MNYVEKTGLCLFIAGIAGVANYDERLFAVIALVGWTIFYWSGKRDLR